MKITFIGCKETNLNIFKELAEALSKKVSNLQLEERFVPFADDLPFVALDCTKESDFVVVFAFVDTEEKADALKSKLVDVEIKSGTRILKAISTNSLDALEEYEFDEAKAELVKKLADTIVAVLFNEEEFEPEEKDFSD